MGFYVSSHWSSSFSPLSHHIVGVDPSPSHTMRPQVGVPANSPVNPSPGSQHHVNESLQTIAVFTFQTPFLTPTSHPTKSCPNWSFVSKVNVVAVLSSKFWSNLWLSQGNRTKMLMYWSHYRRKNQTSQLCPCLFQCHQMLQIKIWGALNLHLVSSKQSPAFSMSAGKWTHLLALSSKTWVFALFIQRQLWQVLSYTVSPFVMILQAVTIY